MSSQVEKLATSSRAIEPASRWERAVHAFAPIRRGEGWIVVALALDLFLIMCGYYALKTAREGLLLADGGGSVLGLYGAQLKTAATALMALVLLVVVPAYGWLAGRVSRLRLITISYLAVLGSLAGFAALGALRVPVGFAFYLWLGIVNVFLIGQFWSYANDLCTEDQGRRLFGVVAIGGAAGAIIGPRVALAADVHVMMVLAGAMLAVSLGLFHAVEGLGRRTVALGGATATRAQRVIAGPGAFRMIWRDQYLLLIAAMLVVANVVNTVGEIILAGAAIERAAATPARPAEATITAFYADFYAWVNLIGFLIQALIAPRLLARTGPATLLFVLPMIALTGYGLVGLAGGVAVVRATKLAENSVDYSLQNTVRHALFLPTSRAAKYKAKAAIDTFFVRCGDLVAAGVAIVGLTVLDLSPHALAAVNVVLALGWIAIAAALAWRHRRVIAAGSTGA